MHLRLGGARQFEWSPNCCGQSTLSARVVAPHTSHSKKPLLSARIPPPDRQFKRQGRGLTESKGKRQCGSESLLKVKVKSGKGRWSLLNVQ